MRYAIAMLGLALAALPSLACDYSLQGVVCPSATVYAAPVVQAQVYAAPVQIQYAQAVQQVQFSQVYAQPMVVQRAFVPSYPYGAVAVQRSFAPSYGASFGVQRGFGVQRSFSAAVVAPSVIQSTTVERRGLFGRRRAVSQTTIVR